MDQHGVRRQHIIAIKSSQEGYSAEYAVIYSNNYCRFQLSASLSRDIIQHRLRWLHCQASEHIPFDEQIDTELHRLEATPAITYEQVAPDFLGMEKIRLNLN